MRLEFQLLEFAAIGALNGLAARLLLFAVDAALVQPR
jgi:hypothetical protein